MKKRKINITVQYALSYCVVIVVTALFVFLMVEWILLQHKETLVKNVKENVHAYMNELELVLAKQQELAQEIFSDDLTSPENITVHPIQTVKGMKQLELYKNSLLLNDYVFLRYPGYEELILHSGTMSIESFMKYELKLDEASKDVFRTVMEAYSGATSNVLIGSKGETIFAWTYSFRNSFNGRKGIVGFGNYGSTFRTYLENAIREMPFYAVMVSDDGKVVFETNKLSDMSDVDLSNIRELILSGKETSVKGYTMDVYESVNGFMLCIALEDDYILSDFNEIVTVVFIVGCAIFAVAFLFIIFVNSIHVKQIKKIRDGLLGLEETGEVLNVNEFSQIQELIKTLYKEQTRRVEERSSLNQTMSELTAKLLLSGRLEGKEYVLRELVTNFCPDLQANYYVVVGVISSEPCDELRGKLIRENSFLVCSEAQDERSNLFYLIMNLPDADVDGGKRKGLAEKLVNEASACGMQNLFVVTGRPYEKLYEINHSYQEVLLLTNVLLCSSEQIVDKIFVFDLVIQERAKANWPEEKRVVIETALTEGTSEEANRAVAEFFAHSIKKENAANKDFELYVLVDTLEKLLRKAGFDETQIKRLKKEAFEDVDTLKKSVLKLITEMKAVPIDEILAYIRKNYKDNTMGLDTLAARFNMSVSHLSHKIKGHIGENYSEYIVRIRVEEACRLLRETNINVRDIASEVGYSDYSSFSRKFKSRMGVTLKGYRDQCREESEKE